MTEVNTGSANPIEDEDFDYRQQPGHLISTAELDTLLQDLNKEHPPFCRWDPTKEDQCEPETWHPNVCADDAASIDGHGYLADMFRTPAELQQDHEEHGEPKPAIIYSYLTVAAAFYLLRETRALRDEQAARHEEAMGVQREILEELRCR